MNTVRFSRARTITAAGVVAIAALALAGCDSTEEGSATPSSSASAEAKGLAADVAAAQALPDSYPVPTEAVSDGTALQGATVYYVPITLQSPQFAVTQQAFTEALEALGASVQVCDGQGTPTAVSACIDQGRDAKAAAIVTDAVAYGVAGNSLDAAQAAGIPVVISNQVPNADHPDSATLANIPAGGTAQAVSLAQWVTVDSDGQANLLANIGQDGPAPAAFFAAAQEVYDQECPDCVIVENGVSSANFPQIAPSTQSALLANPDTDYVYSQFAQYLQPTLGGIQGAGMSGKAKVLAGSVQLDDLESVADGSLAAAAGQASAFQGWVDADVVLRLVNGDELPEYTIPTRLFTADNIGDIDLTADAEASGEWYGPVDFTDEFKKVWGVS
ncbi:sugar ABC transporter substrate-binding protein [Microbacterium sp. NPDC058389]|uniref:sugar ABC transporter substrate-binding protein n=1 Tax=Microbacterium sp. NPDC058389 TaxID=3346475 RepID=UPI0036689232